MPILTFEAWARIRADYEHSETPIEDICAEHGISSGTLRDRRRRWNWTPRRQPIPLDGPPPLPPPPILAPPCDPAPREAGAPPPEPVAPVPSAEPQVAPAPPGLPVAPQSAWPATAGAPPEATPAAIARRLQGAVARVLPAIETTLGTLTTGTTQPREMERAARALGALTRTLRELNALLGQHPTADDDGPDNLDDFRRELVGKIEAIIAARTEQAAGGE